MADTGIYTSYDLTAGTKLDVEDMIALLDPYDVPLLGTHDPEGRRSIRRGTATQIRPDWLDDTLLNPRAVAAAAATTGASVLTVDDRLSFTTGDVILTTAQEHIRVTGYGTTTNTLLISRGFGSSTDATIDSGSDLVGVGTALTEGIDPDEGRYVDRSTRFNYLQIFGPYKTQVSETENMLDKYGLTGGEMDYQIAKNLKQAGITLEQAIMYGVRSIDTSANLRTMGGMHQFISSNRDDATTVLTEAVVVQAAQDIYDAGGNATRVLTSTSLKKKMSAFTSDLIQLDRSDKTRGQIVTYYECDFATLYFMKSRWARQTDLFMYDDEQPELLSFRDWQFHRLGKTGDSEKGFLVGEKSLRFHRESHAAYFTALT